MIFALLFPFLLFAEEKPVLIEFKKEITTCINTEVLWKEFEMAMTNSNDTWLWPNENSQSEGDGLIEEGQILVTYNSYFFDPTYSYELSNVVEFESFTYLSVAGEHPFDGGATITLAEDDHGMSTLLWDGHYYTKSSDWVQRRFFKNFSHSFFNNLEQNIKAHEYMCDADKML